MFINFLRSNNKEKTTTSHKTVAQSSAIPPVVREDKPHVVPVPVEDVRREPQWHDDSLSSLSIESEDDTNLLSQVRKSL